MAVKSGKSRKQRFQSEPLFGWSESMGKLSAAEARHTHLGCDDAQKRRLFPCRANLKNWSLYAHQCSNLNKFGEEENSLTVREDSLLQILVENANQVADRSLILTQIWGADDFFNARSMDVFITKLRKKLQDDPEIQILNVRGYGFKLVCWGLLIQKLSKKNWNL